MNDKDSMVLFLLRFATIAALAITAYVGYVVINRYDQSGTQLLVATALVAGFFVVKKASS